MTAVLARTATTAELAATVAGPVLLPGDDGYADEVASFCMTHAAVPAVVVGARSAQDVAATVRWARGPVTGCRCRAPATACSPTSPTPSWSAPGG